MVTAKPLEVAGKVPVKSPMAADASNRLGMSDFSTIGISPSTRPNCEFSTHVIYTPYVLFVAFILLSYTLLVLIFFCYRIQSQPMHHTTSLPDSTNPINATSLQTKNFVFSFC